MDPLSLRISGFLQLLLDMAGRRAEAQAEYERSKDLSGDRQRWEWLALLRLWSRKDATNKAIADQFQVLTANPGLDIELNYTMQHLADRPEAALDAARQAFGDPANQDITRTISIALLGDHYGDRDLAFAAMRRIVDMRGANTYMFWMPWETGLRADPRFKAIVSDLGLVDYWRSSGNWGDFAKPIGEGDYQLCA